jgi:hypothetical protein
LIRLYPFGKACLTDQQAGMGRTLFFMNFPANNLAAVDVFDQVEIVEAPFKS